MWKHHILSCYGIYCFDYVHITFFFKHFTFSVDTMLLVEKMTDLEREIRRAQIELGWLENGGLLTEIPPVQGIVTISIVLKFIFIHHELFSYMIICGIILSLQTSGNPSVLGPWPMKWLEDRWTFSIEPCLKSRKFVGGPVKAQKFSQCLHWWCLIKQSYLFKINCFCYFLGLVVVTFTNNWVGTSFNAYIWNRRMDLAHLKFYGLV